MRFRLILLLSLIAAAESSAPQSLTPASKTPPASAPSADANGQKARQLVDQAVQALGGAAYLNLQDMRQEGRT